MDILCQNEVQCFKRRDHSRRKAVRLSQDHVQCYVGFNRVVVTHEVVRSDGGSRRGSTRSVSPQRGRIVSQFPAARNLHPEGPQVSHQESLPPRAPTRQPSAAKAHFRCPKTGAPYRVIALIGHHKKGRHLAAAVGCHRQQGRNLHIHRPHPGCLKSGYFRWRFTERRVGCPQGPLPDVPSASARIHAESAW